MIRTTVYLGFVIAYVVFLNVPQEMPLLEKSVISVLAGVSAWAVSTWLQQFRRRRGSDQDGLG